MIFSLNTPIETRFQRFLNSNSDNKIDHNMSGENNEKFGNSLEPTISFQQFYDDCSKVTATDMNKFLLGE